MIVSDASLVNINNVAYATQGTVINVVCISATDAQRLTEEYVPITVTVHFTT